nr:DUF971 domain-containing protein [Rhizomicrobium palustre]
MKDKRTLRVGFENGESYELPAEYLRVESPSAEVQGHSPAEKITVRGKENVAITALEPVGNYAVRIVFDDGHNTGLYTWDYLAKLGQGLSTIWAAYLASKP